MTERSYPWGGTTTGDATLAPYDDDEWSDIWRKLYTMDRTVQGVILDYANELVVTNPAGTTIRMATGAALVDGKFYENDANIDFAGVAPGAGSNYYTLVLRKSFAGQTVRAVLLGPSPIAPPAVTQVDGTTWEISIATIEITNLGVVTITPTYENAITPLSDKRIVYARQGGDPDHWGDYGSTDYYPRETLKQGGVYAQNIANGSYSDIRTITFPVAYPYIPWVLISVLDSESGGWVNMVAHVVDITETDFQFRIQTYDHSNAGVTGIPYRIVWEASGPRP